MFMGVYGETHQSVEKKMDAYCNTIESHI